LIVQLRCKLVCHPLHSQIQYLCAAHGGKMKMTVEETKNKDEDKQGNND